MSPVEAFGWLIFAVAALVVVAALLVVAWAAIAVAIDGWRAKR